MDKKSIERERERANIREQAERATLMLHERMGSDGVRGVEGGGSSGTFTVRQAAELAGQLAVEQMGETDMEVGTAPATTFVAPDGEGLYC